ncbi:MAG: integrase family protein [Streptosporangiaceae bacterium]|nr:integrase family protein [Streptosporangiaceae bacterium]
MRSTRAGLRATCQGLGETHPGKDQPAPGKAWTDSGEVHESRGLKHRSRKTVRPVPIPPELVRLIREHLDRFGTNPDGRIFRSVNGKPISPQTYSKVWARTRKIGLPPDKYGSVLLKRPYDLRHSGITVRLYAGVPPKQVAQWAGPDPAHRDPSRPEAAALRGVPAGGTLRQADQDRRVPDHAPR